MVEYIWFMIGYGILAGGYVVLRDRITREQFEIFMAGVFIMLLFVGAIAMFLAPRLADAEENKPRITCFSKLHEQFRKQGYTPLPWVERRFVTQRDNARLLPTLVCVVELQKRVSYVDVQQWWWKK